MGEPGTSPLMVVGGVSLITPVTPVIAGPVVTAPRPRQRTNAPQAWSGAHPDVNLYIENEPGSGEYAPSERWGWRRITEGRDGADTTATLMAGLDSEQLAGGGAIGAEHFSQLLDLLSPDVRVRIAQRFGAKDALVYFQGYPQAPSVHWDEGGQSLSCMCISEGQEALRTAEGAQILGRQMNYSPLSAWDPYDWERDVKVVSSLPVIFNEGGEPNRSAGIYPCALVNNDFVLPIPVHLFVEDNAPGASYWSYVDALRYVAFFYAHRPGLAVSVTEFLADTNALKGIEPSPEDSDPFVRRLTARVEDVAVASVDADTAIGLLCQAAGVHYEIAIRSRRDSLGGVAGEHYLRVFASASNSTEASGRSRRQMGTPKVGDIPREPPFTSFGQRSALSVALKGRAQKAGLTYDRRGVNAPIVLGGHRDRETTLLLRPGWLPHAMLDNLDTADARSAAIAYWEQELGWNLFEDGDTRKPKSVYYGTHPDHHDYNEVGRYWMFPDDHRWSSRGEEEVTSDYARSNWPASLYGPYDPNDGDQLVYVRRDIGGGIASARDWLPRRRPFRETIGRSTVSDDRSPIVHLSFDATDPETALDTATWVRYGGKVFIDEHRAGLYINEANMWNAPPLLTDPNDPTGMNMLRAFIEGHFMVAVTCVVRGDERLVYRPTPTGASFTRRRARVIDTGDRFPYRNRRSQNSMLDAQGFDVAQFEPRPVLATELLEAYGDRGAEINVGDTVSGSFETFWFDTTYRMGDSFTGVEGLGLTFGRFPEVVRREFVYDPAAGYRTVIHLSDLRENPEVGYE